MTGLGIQSFLAVAVVLALVGTLAWVARRGGLASIGKRGPISVETAVPLGDRRSIVIVSLYGLRLRLGLTPMQVSMVAELRSPGSFDDEVAART